MVGEGPVGPTHEKVTAVGGKVLRVIALDQVVQRDHAVRHDETRCPRTPLALPAGALGIGQAAACARIHRLLATVGRRSRVQVGPSAVARVHEPALLKGLKRRAICLVAVMLEKGARIPSEAQTGEIALHRIDEAGLRALPV